MTFFLRRLAWLGLVVAAASPLPAQASTPAPSPAAAPAEDPARVARWRQVVQRLASAERRLVLRTGAAAGPTPAEARAKSAEIKGALLEARDGARTDPGLGPQGHREVDGFIDRALAEVEQQTGRLGPAGAVGAPAGPSGPDPVREVASAERFLQTYDQALLRFLQLLRRTAIHPLAGPLKKKDLPGIRARLVGGYRQGEALVQRARSAARAGAVAGDHGRAEAPLRRLDQHWRRVERDFRIGRRLVEELVHRFLGPPCPGGDCGEPSL